MPSVSRKQQGFMGAELARARSGQPTDTGMSQDQLADFAGTPTAGLPPTAAPPPPPPKKHKHKHHAPPKGFGRSANQRGGKPF